jgi:hypothetical protein
MRTRRAFRPTFDFMPTRIAPSNAGIFVNYMDPSTVPGTLGTPVSDPMDPSSTPGSDLDPSSTDIYDSGPSSPPVLTPTTSLC